MESKEIYFAAGCFWGTQRLFQCIDGVLQTSCGYANGKDLPQPPSYQQVCTGDTGCRETVCVTYDPSRVSLSQLLKAFFYVVDPTVRNRQGNDIGSQYQTGIYYVDSSSAAEVRSYLEEEKQKHPVFQVESGFLKQFFPAEDYHQDYLLKNPRGYCHIPRIAFETIDGLIR